jgi:hypothetical protein
LTCVIAEAYKRNFPEETYWDHSHARLQWPGFCEEYIPDANANLGGAGKPWQISFLP